MSLPLIPRRREIVLTRPLRRRWGPARQRLRLAALPAQLPRDRGPGRAPRRACPRARKPSTCSPISRTKPRPPQSDNIIMKMRTPLILLLVLALEFSASAAPVKIIFDTDMAGDVDDVGALALLHALEN